MWLKTVQEDKELLKADGLLRDKENLIGKQKSCKKSKAKQGINSSQGQAGAQPPPEEQGPSRGNSDLGKQNPPLQMFLLSPLYPSHFIP